MKYSSPSKTGWSAFLTASYLFACCASAFSNTSPMLVISNEKELQADSKSDSVEWSVDSVVGNLGKSLGCNYDTYILTSQYGIDDDRDINSQNTPYLVQMAQEARSYTVYSTLISTTNVEDAFSQLASEIVSECGAQPVDTDTFSDDFEPFVDTQPRVIKLQLDGGSLETDDEYLRSVLQKLPTGNFVVVYLGHEEADSKSSAAKGSAAKSSQITTSNVLTNSTSLFANYQFFTPGIYMTGLVTFFVIAVFMVALNWLQSLKISYVAFEAEKKN